MISPFFSYFYRYLWHAKTRQSLLFLAVAGLFLSSFALIVVQSSMGGLQGKLVERSKNVLGHGVIELPRGDQSDIDQVSTILGKIPHFAETTIELLAKYRGRIAPVIAHGVDWSEGTPSFIESEGLSEAIIGRDFSFKMRLSPGDRLELISGAHVDSLLGDVPRFISVDIERVIGTDVADVDMFHLWLPIAKIQNLTRSRTVSSIRYYEKLSTVQKEQLEGFGAKIRTWEEGHSTLVWALSLESSVMIFLFFGMTLLVSLCITSGLLLFFGKIKLDLTSFWILGAAKGDLMRMTSKLSYSLVFISALSGLVAGLGFLTLFDLFGGEILPDIFVDRKIPIDITLHGILLALVIPLGIGLLFARLSLIQGDRDEDYLTLIRSAN